ncbi:MAG: PH domain-containing protein [Candidatus Bathyarchaeia archaeon]
MPKIYKPCQTHSTTFFGLVIAAIVAIPLVPLLFLSQQAPVFFQAFLAVVLVAILGLILYATISGRKMSYDLDDAEFRVNFSLWKIKIPYSSIKNVQATQLTLSLRLFGGSWPGLHWGLFKATNIGQVYAYSTKAKGTFVLLELADSRKIAITPEDIEGFITEIESRMANSGKTMEGISKPFETSKKAVHLQVLTVTISYLLLLGYFIAIYPSLPEIIAVHFDWNWNPNRWAHKSELFLLIGIAAIYPLINAAFMLKYGK